MPSSCGPAPSRGFTLIEALVVIAVAGILASLAVPSFQNLIARNRLSAGATDVLTGLKVAKNEAIRRNQSMRFCINPTTRAWRVATVGGDEFRVGAINGALTIHTASLDGAAVPDHQCVRFRPDGLAYGSGLITNGNITLGASGNSRVINIRTGAIHVG